jgi:hypothetical protein
VSNQSDYAVSPTLYVITANSGFFESIRGSSRIIKGVLSEQDIIAAPLAPAGTRGSLARMIGGKLTAFANRLGLMKSGPQPLRGREDAMKEEEAARRAALPNRPELKYMKGSMGRSGGGLAARLM